MNDWRDEDTEVERPEPPLAPGYMIAIAVGALVFLAWALLPFVAELVGSW